MVVVELNGRRLNIRDSFVDQYKNKGYRVVDNEPSNSTASTTSPQYTPSQQSARDWINNPKSGFGSVDDYVANQIKRYDQAYIQGDQNLINRLEADSKRVGYDVYSPTKVWAEDQVKQQQEAQRNAIMQNLERLQQSTNFVTQQNNQALQENLAKLQEQKSVNDQTIQQLQNRRGGFYSGGTDYQLGNNTRAFTEASGNLQRDVQSRNNQLWNSYGLQAQQAYDNIMQLEQSAPAMIQQLIQQKAAQDRQLSMDEAQLTGLYNGMPTMDYQNMNFNQALQQNKLNLDQQQQQFNQNLAAYNVMYQRARDEIEDEKWKLQFDEDVRRYGLDYALDKQYKMGNLSVAQKNAETARFNAETNRMQEQRLGLPQDQTQQRNDLSAKDYAANYLELREGLRNYIDPQTKRPLTQQEMMIVLEENRDVLSDSDYRKLLESIYSGELTQNDDLNF